MRISVLITCDPEIPVPPKGYGGIERIVEILVNGLTARGHKVVLCANAESKVPCDLVAWRGTQSQHFPDIIKNTVTLTKTVVKRKFDIIHSFSRLAYMGLIMPSTLPKIMSYQREPSVSQVKKAVWLSSKNSIFFTGCSNYITDQIRPVARAKTIYNAAPVQRYSFNPVVEHDAPLVFLGRVEDIKGVHEAIVVARKSGRRLVIAGNIPKGKEDYFFQKIQPCLDETIVYVGPVDDQQKNQLLGSAAALLMPIQWNEPFGIVMAEAMACGTPVIGLAKGAVPEVVESGSSGYVCNSIDQMAEMVHRLHLINRQDVRTIAENRFSEHAMVENYINLYRTLICKTSL